MMDHSEHHQKHNSSAPEPIVVIKVGTSSLIRASCSSLNLLAFAGLAETVRDLRNDGYRVILISSGAVGVGCQRLSLPKKPAEISKKQALAAVGQVHMMRVYQDLFSEVGLTIGQVLLTLDNLASRQQYLNARSTFHELLEYGVIPVVNENDTVAIEGLRIGNNDALAAQVANLVEADYLFLLTDVDALYTSDPNTDPNAQPIRIVTDPASLQVDTNGGQGGTQWGTGGMSTKITAANHAFAAGTKMVICHSDPENVLRVLRGEKNIGTCFLPAHSPVKGRRRWILNVPVKGSLVLDPGAVLAVRDHGSSLFSSGIKSVDGDFNHQDAVALVDALGKEFGRALINYSAHEMNLIKGKSSRSLEALLGYTGPEEACHRANICLIPRYCGSEASSAQHSAVNSDNEEEEETTETESSFNVWPHGEKSPKGPLSRATTPAPVNIDGEFWKKASLEETTN